MGAKFTKELENLVRDKVISATIASQISSYYVEKNNTTSNKLFVIFGVFGALLIGSGILLMIAHNWDNFSRGIKTTFAFLPLLIGQVVAGYTIIHNKNNTWREASGTFLCFGVASCISLVSQIYHIPGDVSSFLLTWISLTLPIIYVLQSRVVAIMMIIASTYYAVEVGYWNYRNSNTPWMYVVFIATILPFYWTQVSKSIISNATTFFNWVLPISVMISLAAFIDKNDELGFVLYITFFGMCYAIGRLPLFGQTKKMRNGFLIIGSLGLVVSLLMCTFSWPWEDFDINTVFYSQEFCIAVMLAAITSLFSVYSIKKEGIQYLNLFQISFVIYWMLFFLIPDSVIIPVIITNVLVLALGIYTIRIGANALDLGILNYGLVIISVLIICRFFDTNMSFVVRGILFVLVGAGFFFANYLMLRKTTKTAKSLDEIEG